MIPKVLALLLGILILFCTDTGITQDKLVRTNHQEGLSRSTKLQLDSYSQFPTTQFGTLLDLDEAYNGTRRIIPSLDTVVKQLSQAGVLWIRSPLPMKDDNGWFSPDSDHGAEVLRKLDAFLSLTGQYGIKVILTVKPVSKIRRNERKSIVAETPFFMRKLPEWQDFVRYMASRYKSKIGAWQFGNEMNHLRNWTGTPKEYVEFLKASFEAVKEIDKSATVLMGGLAAGDIISEDGDNLDAVEYFAKLASAGVLAYCDAVDFHVYRELQSFEAVTNGFHAQMDEQKAFKPIWITESGFSQKQYPSASESIVAREIFKRIIIPASLGTSVVLWSRSIDRLTNIESGPRGLFDLSWNAKSSFFAYQKIAPLMNNMRFVRQIPFSDGLILLFENEDQRILTAWTETEDRKIFIVSPPKLGTLITANGRSKKIKSSGAKLRLRIGPEPLIVKAETGWEPVSKIVDLCPTDPKKKEPGQCGCGIPDLDSDKDKTPNCLDECSRDSHKTAPGQCGCGKADTDTDKDGLANCKDECPKDPNKVEKGICGCGNGDIDENQDGIIDCLVDHRNGSAHKRQ